MWERPFLTATGTAHGRGTGDLIQATRLMIQEENSLGISSAFANNSAQRRKLKAVCAWCCGSSMVSVGTALPYSSAQFAALFFVSTVAGWGQLPVNRCVWGCASD